MSYMNAYEYPYGQMQGLGPGPGPGPGPVMPQASQSNSGVIIIIACICCLMILSGSIIGGIYIFRNKCNEEDSLIKKLKDNWWLWILGLFPPFFPLFIAKVIVWIIC